MFEHAVHLVDRFADELRGDAQRLPDLRDRSAVAPDPTDPDRTTSVCPSGCVCQAVCAPGSKVTIPAPAHKGGASV